MKEVPPQDGPCPTPQIDQNEACRYAEDAFLNFDDYFPTVLRAIAFSLYAAKCLEPHRPSDQDERRNKADVGDDFLAPCF